MSYDKMRVSTLEGSVFTPQEIEALVQFGVHSMEGLTYPEQVDLLKSYLRNSLHSISASYNLSLTWQDLQIAYQMLLEETPNKYMENAFSMYYWKLLEDIFSDKDTSGIYRTAHKGQEIPHDWYWAAVKSTIAVPICFVPGGVWLARTLWASAVTDFFLGCKTLSENVTRGETRTESGKWVPGSSLYRIHPCVEKGNDGILYRMV